MAKETALTQFQGEDRRYVFTQLDSTELVALDITTWALSFMVKRYKSDADGSALIAKTTASGIVISGTFDSVPATNTQIATVTMEDTDTTVLADGLFSWELKRTDAGFETVVAFGPFDLIQGVHR